MPLPSLSDWQIEWVVQQVALYIYNQRQNVRLRVSGLDANQSPRQSNFLRRVLHPALKKLGIEKQGFHGFRHFRVTHLESNDVPQALSDYWTGHAKKGDGEDVQKTMNQLYTKMETETVFREEVAERIGIGFDLPKPAVVQVFQEMWLQSKSKMRWKS